jgi:flavodoxin
MNIDAITALYFSGTGNTRYAAERLTRGLGVADEAILSIEKPKRELKAVAEASAVIIAHPNSIS